VLASVGRSKLSLSLRWVLFASLRSWFGSTRTDREDEPAVDGGQGVRVMRFTAMLMGAMLTIVLALGVAQAAGRTANGRCWTNPGSASVGQTVEIWADGLPTKTALNIFVTDPHGTYGWPVGVQPSGTVEGVWYVPDEAGTSTIRITGPERPNNVKVYATCGMEVS
jgi:hypothetical protein